MNKEKQNIIQLKNNSYQAFDQLYVGYERLLYGFVFRLTRSHSITKELVQDTFISIWINRHSIDENQSFKSWLFKIAQNKIIDNFRKQWKEPLMEDYMNLVNNENLKTTNELYLIDLDDFKRALNASKKKLSPRQREVFNLIKQYGKSAPEVAAQLSISEQAVYNYLSQSLKILREDLKHYQFLFILFFI